MDLKQFNELVDRIKLSKEIIEMSNDIFYIRKYLNALLITKGRFRKGDIAKGVNISIEPLNKKYNTNFKCDKDEDFINVLTKMVNHINAKGDQILNKKIEEEITKKIMKL